METVGIRELKNRLSEYLRLVRSGQAILVTDRGEVVVELRQPSRTWLDEKHPRLAAYVREGGARLGETNQPGVYSPCKPVSQHESAQCLLDEERAEL